MATIDQLQQLYGTKSPEDAILRASKEFGISPTEIASEVGYKVGGQWGNRLGASIDSYQANLYGVGEALGSEWAGRRRQENEAAAELQRGFAREQGAISSYKDVGGIGDAFNYVGGLAVDSLPYLGEAVLGGGVGGLAARGLALGARGANAARTMGGVAASYPSAVGDVLSSQREESGTMDLGSAAALGVPYAALNAFGLEGAAARVKPFRIGTDMLDGMQGVRGGLARAGVTGATTGFKEGLSETGQEFVNQIGRNAVNPNAGYFGPEALDRYGESFVGGAALGGVTGASLGGWRRSEGYQPPAPAPVADPDPGTQTDLLTPPPPAPPGAPAQLGWNGRFEEPMFVMPNGQAVTREQFEAFDPVVQNYLVSQHLAPDRPMSDIAGPAIPPYAPTQVDPESAGFGALYPGETGGLPGDNLPGGFAVGGGVDQMRGLDRPSGFTTAGYQGPQPGAFDLPGFGADMAPPAGPTPPTQPITTGDQLAQAGNPAPPAPPPTGVDKEVARLQAERKAANESPMVDRGPNGVPVVPLQTQEINTHTFIRQAQAAGIVSEAQVNTLFARVKDALQRKDKKDLNAVHKEAVALKEQADAAGAGGNGGAGPTDVGRGAGGQRAPGQPGDVRPAGPGAAAQAVPGSMPADVGAVRGGSDAALTEPAAPATAPVIGTNAPDAVARVEQVVGRALTPKEQKIAQRLASMGPRNQSILRDLLGIDEEGHQSREPLSYEETAAKYVNEAGPNKGKPMDRQGLQAMLKKVGIDVKALDALRGTMDLPTVSTEELGIASTDRAEGAAAQATGYRVTDQVSGGADDFVLDARTVRDQKETDRELAAASPEAAAAADAEIQARKSVTDSEFDAKRAAAAQVTAAPVPTRSAGLRDILARDLARNELAEVDIEDAAEAWDAELLDGDPPFDTLDPRIQAQVVRAYRNEVLTARRQGELIDEDRNFKQSRADRGRGAEGTGRPGGAQPAAIGVSQDAGAVGQRAEGGATTDTAATGTQDVGTWGDQATQLKSQARPGGEALLLHETKVAPAGWLQSQAPYAAALKALDALGLGHMMGWVSEVRMAGMRGPEVADGWIEGRGSQYVLTLKDAAAMTDFDAIWTLNHELGHAADLAVSGGVYSAHKDLAFDVVDGKIVARGAVAQELQALHDDGDFWGAVLEYPLGSHYQLNDAEEIQAEVFAQLFAMYARPNGRAKLQLEAPLAFQFIEDSVNDIRQNRPLRVRTPGEVKARSASFAQRYRGVSRRQPAQPAAGGEGPNSGGVRRSGGQGPKVADLQAARDAKDEAFERWQAGSGNVDDLWRQRYPGRWTKGDVGSYEGQRAEVVEVGSGGRVSVRLPSGRTVFGIHGSELKAFTGPRRVNFSRANGAAAAVEQLEAARAEIRARMPAPAQDAMTTIGDAVYKYAPYLMSNFQLMEQFGARIAGLAKHIKLTDLMTREATRQQMAYDAVGKRWEQLRNKSRLAFDDLNKLMTEASRLAIHPDHEFGEKEWNDHLPPERKADHARLAAEYKRLERTYPEAIAIYHDALKVQNDSWEAQKKALDDLYDKYEVKRPDLKKVPGPYFPLMRHGDYLVVAKSQEMLDLEESIKGVDDPTIRREADKILAEMSQDPKHYWMSAHESRASQERELARQQATGNFASVTAPLASQRLEHLPANVHNTVVRLTSTMSKQFDKGTVDQIQKAVAEMLLQTMPEGHALERQAKRRGVSGSHPDMLRSFVSAGRSNAFYTARTMFAKDIAVNMGEMKDKVKGNVDMTHIVREVEKRVALDMQFTDTPVQNAISSFSWIYHLGASPAFLAMNALQPALVSFPVLAGRFGAAAAVKELGVAWREALAVMKAARFKDGKWDPWSGISEASIKSRYPAVNDKGEQIGEERKAIRELMLRGIVDEGLVHDLGRLADGRYGRLEQATRITGWASQQIELMNRVSTALATFRLARAEFAKNGMDPKDAYEMAVEEAYRATVKTQIDYSAEGAPRVMRTGGGVPLAKLVFQFRRYQQGMFYLLASNARSALKGDKHAMATLGYLGMVTGAVGGAIGLPFMNAALFAVDQMLDDDDEEGDAETRLRNLMVDITGDREFATVLSKGLPALLGMDLSKRIGLGDVATLIRMDDVEKAKTERDKLGQLLLALGGPSAGAFARVWEGANLMAEGDLLRGVERVLPKMAGDPVQGYRLATQGMTDRKGEQILGPDELGAWDKTVKALGIQPVDTANIYEADAAKKKVQTAIEARKTRIHKEFRFALRDGDMADVRDMINEFNEDHPQHAIKPKDELAWRKDARRQESLRGPDGIKFNPRRDQPYEELQRFARG